MNNGIFVLNVSRNCNFCYNDNNVLNVKFSLLVKLKPKRGISVIVDKILIYRNKKLKLLSL